MRVAGRFLLMTEDVSRHQHVVIRTVVRYRQREPVVLGPLPVVLAALCAVVLMLPIMVLRYLKYGLAKFIDEKYGGRSGPRVNMQVIGMGNWNRVARSHHTACSYAVPEALGLAQVGTHTRLERNM